MNWGLDNGPPVWALGPEWFGVPSGAVGAALEYAMSSGVAGDGGRDMLAQLVPSPTDPLAFADATPLYSTIFDNCDPTLLKLDDLTTFAKQVGPELRLDLVRVTLEWIAWGGGVRLTDYPMDAQAQAVACWRDSDCEALFTILVHTTGTGPPSR